MRKLGRIRAALVILALCAGQAVGQDGAATDTTGASPAPADPKAPPEKEPGQEPAKGPEPEKDPDKESEKAWLFSLSAYLYIVPDDDDFVQPTATVDRGLLHLEARYNYEALDTGSLWAGCNFSGGESLSWEVTPMLGGVFGHTQGVAPGVKGSVGWWKLELYSESEWLFDTEDYSDSFFYTWSELTIAPVEWIHLGLVTQRTRAYETDRDIQRGLLAEIAFKSVSFRTIIFNLDESDPILVLGLGLSFEFTRRAGTIHPDHP